MQLPVSLLHGCSIHMPSEAPAARHLAPPPKPLDSAADLLQHVKAHVPAQVIGHVALEGSDAASEWNEQCVIIAINTGCCSMQRRMCQRRSLGMWH
jgi:hypothetical protein